MLGFFKLCEICFNLDSSSIVFFLTVSLFFFQSESESVNLDKALALNIARTEKELQFASQEKVRLQSENQELRQRLLTMEQELHTSKRHMSVMAEKAFEEALQMLCAAFDKVNILFHHVDMILLIVVFTSLPFVLLDCRLLSQKGLGLHQLMQNCLSTFIRSTSVGLLKKWDWKGFL